MAEYSRMAKGSFFATSSAKVINLPFQPDFVEIWNYTNIKTAGASTVTRAWWDKGFIDVVENSNPTMIELYDAGTATVFDTIQTNGISTFSGGLMLQYGPAYFHNSVPGADFAITATSPPIITTATPHGLESGDVIIFSNLYQTAVTGMQQITGIPFYVLVANATQFSLNWDASGANYTAFDTTTSLNNVGSFKKVLYPDLYFPGTSIISDMTLGATTTITTTAQHNMQVGQQIAFHIPNTWGPYQLNELPNVQIPGSPITGYITSITDALTFVVNINSTGYTAFDPNQTFVGTPGRTFPQVVAVGDVNTGGVQISAGSQLYPSPLYSTANTNDTSTINGPAIIGSYVNNTRQGFIIGSGIARVEGTASMMIATDRIIWRAYLHDYSSP